MQCAPLLPNRMLNEADLDHRGLARRWLDVVVASRPNRVLCMLAGLWMINLFDLVLTLAAHAQGVLHESNPVARSLLPFGPQVVLVFKLVLVCGSSLVLIHYRSRLVAELAAGLMFLVYAAVAVRWRLCYELYTLSATNSMYESDLQMFDSWTSGLPMI